MKWLRAILTPVTYWRREAAVYKAQAERLCAALERAGYEHSEEVMKLQRDLAFAMDANACIALELAEKDWEVSQLKGEC